MVTGVVLAKWFWTQSLLGAQLLLIHGPKEDGFKNPGIMDRSFPREKKSKEFR
jgi:hypothetical protein